MADSLVEPLDANQPQQPPPVEPAEGAEANFPPELIQIPAMQGLLAGAPPAVSANIKDFAKREEAKLFVQNRDILQQAGIGFYKSMSGDIGVIFNQMHIHPTDLQAADKLGKLTQIAPPIDVVDQQIKKAGLEHPVFSAQVPGGPASAKSPASPPQFATGAAAAPGPSQQPSPVANASGLPAGAQRSLLKSRVASLSPGSPTSGPAPGAGRMLNQVLKTVV